MSVNKWVQIGNTYHLREVSSQIDELPKGVYTLAQDPMTGEIFPCYESRTFEFPYKVYGIETDYIKWVKKTWDNTTGNLGILLNGVKGTGKTVTAQLVCKALDLPVILVTSDMQGLLGFMNSIQQDVIWLFDEYEKAFNTDNKNSTRLLTIMDGVLKNSNRKMFILTTNQKNIDVNLQSRPSRVRYTKEYGNLSVGIITEIVNDKLKYKHLREHVIKFVAQLQLITVDIVSSIIEEVNIHEVDPEEFYPFYNVTKNEIKYDIYEQTIEGNTLVKTNIGYGIKLAVSPSDYQPEDIIWDKQYYKYYGKVVSVTEVKKDEWALVVRHEEVTDKDDNVVKPAYDQNILIHKVPNYDMSYMTA